MVRILACVGASACVCVRVCVCVCVCVHVCMLRIVSMDTIVCFKNTFISSIYLPFLLLLAL